MNAQNTRIAMSPVEQTAYFALIRQGKSVVTTGMLSKLLGIHSRRASQIFSGLKRKAVARHIGKGQYVLLPPEMVSGTGRYIQDSFVILAQAMELAKQEYAVGYVTAAYLHGLMEQIPQVTQVIINRRRRDIRVQESQVIEFIIVSSWKIFGTTKIKHLQEDLAITDIEKTILDCLDRLDLSGGISQVAQILKMASDEGKVNAKKLVQYAKQMRSKALIQRLGYLLEQTKLLPEARDALQRLRQLVPTPLDPRASRQGNLNRKWQIIENVEIDLTA